MIHQSTTLFFRWWIRQLTGLVPFHLLQTFIEAGEATILEITGDSFILQVRRKGVVEPVAGGPLADLRQDMEAIPNLPLLRLLRLPAGQALHKALSLPAAARRSLKTVLGYEIDRETPFEQSEVYWNYSLAGQPATKGKLDVDLVVVPRRGADALVQTAQAAGFSPAALEVAQEDKRSIFLWLEGPNPLRYYRLPQQARLSRVAAYGLIVLLLLTPFAVQQLRFYLADRQIAALEHDARAASALKQAANRRMAALAFMGQMHPGASALEIIAATSRALPDDSFLSSLTVHDGQITMAGSSEGAAKLIGALAASPAFRNPVFDSAVLEGESDSLEKFTISAQLVAQGSS